MEDDLKKIMQPKTIKVKTIIFLKMEEDLNFIEKGRRPPKNKSNQNN
jgi:hypothetical protein